MKRKEFSSHEHTINESNLRYLTQFQNPSLNKLLSTLASDVPLDPVRIKRQLSSSTIDTSTPNSKLLKKDYLDKRIDSEVSQLKIQRNISCNTDPDFLSPQRPNSPNNMTNLPTHYLESLFSPSVFRSPTNSAQYFTFESHHFDPNLSTPQPQPHQSPYNDFLGPSTPRFDEKDFYAILHDTKLLESPKNQESKSHGDVAVENAGISPSSYSKKPNTNTIENEPDISPDDFLALENWLHYQSSLRGEDFGDRPDPTSLPPPPTQNPTNYNDSQESNSSFQSDVNYSLPSIPKIPHVAPSLSIVDLDSVLKTNPDPPKPEVPLLPPLPSIPISIPMSLSREEVLPLPSSLKDEGLKVEEEGQSITKPNKGMYGLCKQLLDYFNTQQSIEIRAGESIEPDKLANKLDIRPRRLKDLFQILDVLDVVYDLCCFRLDSLQVSRLGRHSKFYWNGMTNISKTLGIIQVAFISFSHSLTNFLVKDFSIIQHFEDIIHKNPEVSPHVVAFYNDISSDEFLSENLNSLNMQSIETSSVSLLTLERGVSKFTPSALCQRILSYLLIGVHTP